MKAFVWDKDKNRLLKATRGVSFEEVELLMSTEKGLEVDHHNPSKYPEQSIYVVTIRGYCYLIPYKETDTEIILKTIIPSRKATKKYLKEEGDD